MACCSARPGTGGWRSLGQPEGAFCRRSRPRQRARQRVAQGRFRRALPLFDPRAHRKRRPGTWRLASDQMPDRGLDRDRGTHTAPLEDGQELDTHEGKGSAPGPGGASCGGGDRSVSSPHVQNAAEETGQGRVQSRAQGHRCRCPRRVRGGAERIASANAAGCRPRKGGASAHGADGHGCGGARAALGAGGGADGFSSSSSSSIDGDSSSSSDGTRSGQVT